VRTKYTIVLGKQGVKTAIEFMAKNPVTIIQNNKDKNLTAIQSNTCLQTDVAMPTDGNVIKHVAKRKLR
jgi:hypothetical protein